MHFLNNFSSYNSHVIELPCQDVENTALNLGAAIFVEKLPSKIKDKKDLYAATDKDDVETNEVLDALPGWALG